jgi:hypothetical protein
VSEHIKGRFKAERHKFVFNNGDTAIDADVVAEQSRKQLKDDPATTIVVHHHGAEITCDGHEHDAYGTSLASAAV